MTWQGRELHRTRALALELGQKMKRRLGTVAGGVRAPGAGTDDAHVPEATPTGGARVFENYVHTAPSVQGTVDIFRGEWASQFPAPFHHVKAGTIPLFTDERIYWLFKQLGGVDGKRVLELGPLEGGHTHMLEKAGASSVTAIEGNVRAYLRCLVVKELFGLTRARFLCGDFLEWLRTNEERFELCVASGVLYHMREPVALMELISKCCDTVFFWTHYYDPEVLGTSSPLSAKFDQTLVTEHGGFPHTLHRQFYGPALGSGFCGGNVDHSMWMERDDIIGALRHFGYSQVDVAFDRPDHANGPSLALLARRA